MTLSAQFADHIAPLSCLSYGPAPRAAAQASRPWASAAPQTGAVFMDDLFSDAIDCRGVIDLDKFAQQHRENVAQFDAAFRSILTEEGIDASLPLDMGIGEDGEVIVRDNHPDGQRIEALFRADPEMANHFHKISVGAYMLDPVRLS